MQYGVSQCGYLSFFNTVGLFFNLEEIHLNHFETYFIKILEFCQDVLKGLFDNFQLEFFKDLVTL